MPPVEVVAWAQFVGIASGAALGFGALVGVLYRVTIGQRLNRLAADVTAIRHEVEPNGTDIFLVPEDRGQTTRTLLVRSRVDIGKIEGRLNLGDQRFERDDERLERLEADHEEERRERGQ